MLFENEIFNKEIIMKGVVLGVEYIIFKIDNDKTFSYLKINDNEIIFYDYNLLNVLKCLNNVENDLNCLISLKDIENNIFNEIKGLYNKQFINQHIIERVCYILDNVLSDNEIYLYNEPFNCEPYYNFTEQTFNNNIEYCLKSIDIIKNNCHNDMIIKTIVHYYVSVFIQCCVEIEKTNCYE